MAWGCRHFRDSAQTSVRHPPETCWSLAHNAPWLPVWRYVPKAAEEPWATYSVRWLWLRRYDGNHGTACTKISCKPISETLQFPYLCYPAISIPLQKFRRLERRKTGKNAPKNYSCHRDFASRAVADRRRYTAQKAAASPAR